MNNDMLDATLIEAYLVEAREHLDLAEKALIKIEKQGSAFDSDLINQVFRSVHTVKGGASFCGLNNINILSHELESILDMIRNNELKPFAKLMDQILKSVDKLIELIEDPASSNTVDISPFLKALKDVMKEKGNIPEENAKKEINNILEDNIKVEKPEIITPQDMEKNIVLKHVNKPTHNIEITFNNQVIYFDYDYPQLKAKKSSGTFLYFICLDFIRDCQNKNRTPLDLVQKAAFVGEILTATLPIDMINESDGYPVNMPVYFLYQSPLEAHHLKRVVDLDDSSITEWSDIKIEEEGDEFIPEELIENTSAQFLPVSSSFDNVPDVSIAKKELAPVKDDNIVIHDDSPFQITEIKDKGKKKVETSLRIDIKLLDKLMSLAGELVLSRNQMMQILATNDISRLQNIAQRINLITTELQENIMRTRMQPIGNVFNKFPRIVRDLARSLGKEIDLVIKGEEVELDKNMVEAIGDPLTHLVRNAVDHGIEVPFVRQKKGKNSKGTVTLYAYHEGGQVNIDIIDDGAGIDADKLKIKAMEKNLITMAEAETMSDRDALNLIFLPGFSTATIVTDVSGRGVGMDVVRTNIERLGGIIDIQTEVDKGSTLHIKLPLTLAIIPSLIVRSGSERYAIPQINLIELVKVKACDIDEKIERIHGIEVFRLRGNLLPLLRLSNVLYPGNITENQDINILVLAAGDMQYGLIVDGLNDSEEIVVKPLGRHIKDCECYAGATIMGDGKVALILDVQGIASYSGLSTEKMFELEEEDEKAVSQEGQSVLLFDNASVEQFGISLALVSRIDKIKASEVETIGGRDLIKYRGTSLPVIRLEKYINVNEPGDKNVLYVILFNIKGKNIGLIARNIVDTKDLTFNIDTETLKQPGILGSAIIDNRTTLFLDIFELVQMAEPSWFKEREVVKVDEENPKILVIEDSDFFRSHVRNYLSSNGYDVVEAINGQDGLEKLSLNKIDLVITDIEMPVMDGYEMTKKIKSDPRYSYLKVIALTSMTGEEDIKKGMDAGIDDYQIKFDRENLLDSVTNMLKMTSSHI